LSFSNPYIIYDTRDGREICQCASIQDALMMIEFDPNHRKYKQRQILLDQIVDVASYRMPDDKQLKGQKILTQSDAVPFKG
jgi:hypothetical protein